MALSFTILYHEKMVKADIDVLPVNWREKIKSAIEEKLTIAPDYYGKPLRRSLKGYRKLRVGDYRVVFRIETNILKIFYSSTYY